MQFYVDFFFFFFKSRGTVSPFKLIMELKWAVMLCADTASHEYKRPEAMTPRVLMKI